MRTLPRGHYGSRPKRTRRRSERRAASGGVVPTFIDASAGSEVAAGATMNVAYPASVSAGDNLVMVANGITSGTGVWMVAAGWTERKAVEYASTYHMQIWTKTGAGTEGGTNQAVTQQGGGNFSATAVILRFSGFSTAAPMPQATDIQRANISAMISTTLTTTTPAWVFCVGHTWGSSNFTDAPSDGTLRKEFTTGNTGTLHISTRPAAVPGVYPTVTVTVGDTLSSARGVCVAEMSTA